MRTTHDSPISSPARARARNVAMHIALTVGTFDLSGGIERVTVQLATSYRELGHEVTVFATDWDPVYEDRFRFERVAAPARPAWARTLVLPGVTARRLAHGRYDFVHGQGTSTLRCDLLTYHTVHAAWLEVSLAGRHPLDPRSLARRWRPFHRAAVAMERWQARTHRGRFHTCSRAVREEAIRLYGIDPARVEAIPWGIDLGHFRPDPAVRAHIRAGWEAPEGRPVLLLVANEYHRKGLATLLGALAHWGREDALLVVAGRADHSPYMPMVERLGLAGRVRFVGHQPPAPLYQAADLFVMPTSYEGWALVIGEALASGLPVLTTPFAGSSDLVTPGRNGLILEDPRDERALASLLASTFDGGLVGGLAANARASVADASWTEVARRLLAWGTGGKV